MNDEDRILAALDMSSDWEPDSARAFTSLQARRVAHRTSRRRWLLAGAGTVTAVVALIAVPVQPACAQCVRPVTRNASAETLKTAPPPEAVKTTQPTKALQNAPSVTLRVATVNFKQSGAATAPLACEIYTDYECPACAELYNQTMPAFVEEYVKTGKIRFLHRDLPLPQHRYAKLAARYANAAGSLGFYDTAVQQIFRTQSVWKQDGSVDGQLALVLGPADMEKVRQRVQSDDPELDTTVADDVSAAMTDKIMQTPTIVVIANGKRIPIAGFTPFAMLKAYLDELTGK